MNREEKESKEDKVNREEKESKEEMGSLGERKWMKCPRISRKFFKF